MKKTTTFDGDLLDENETDRKFSISGVRTKEMSKKRINGCYCKCSRRISCNC
ncbi:hypothetical protein [Methanobrevibacter arboriphilus]|uniref:hypothetical protein n=1 Tax=Methanobrevibacter arboriphilus TaxID=39441 RepID=UPI001CDB1CE3|nr:hypothetical protein [Methanobrevibacter arboriphilus]